MAISALTVALLVTFFSAWKILALAIGLAVLALTLWRPEYTVLFLAAYTPFEPFLLKFVPDDIYLYARYFSEGLIYILAASVIWRLVVRRRKAVPTPLDLPFIFFLLVALTSLVVNAVPLFTGILGLRQIIRFILLFFIIVYLRPRQEFVRRLVWLMLGIVFLQGLIGLIQAVVGAPLDEFLIPSERRFFESIQLTSGTQQFWSPGSRVFATLGRFDQLGTFLCFFFLLAIGLAYHLRDKDRRRTLVAVVALAFPAFVLTLSRASWFGFAIALFFIAAVLMKDRRVRVAYLAVAVMAVAYLAWSGITVRYLVDYPEQTLVERFFETFSYERWRGEYYGMGRLFWVVQTVKTVVPASPLFGVGPGQYGGGAAAALGNTRVYERLNLPFGVYGTEGYIDNNWFSLWGETGTLGLVFFAWMLWALFSLSLRVWKRAKDAFVRGLALGYAGCVLAVAFQGFFATYFEVRTLAFYLWLFGALVFVLGRRERVLR